MNLHIAAWLKFGRKGKGDRADVGCIGAYLVILRILNPDQPVLDQVLPHSTRSAARTSLL